MSIDENEDIDEIIKSEEIEKLESQIESINSIAHEAINEIYL